jgi:hypothetical protein
MFDCFLLHFKGTIVYRMCVWSTPLLVRPKQLQLS